MTDLQAVPLRIAQMVNEHIRAERNNIEMYDNREHLDHSGVWDLHALARAIYAAGWSDGYQTSAEAERGLE